MRKPLLFLPNPKPDSHKGQNGVLLIIGGSRTYHGAPVLAVLGAMRFCDLVYFSSTTGNMALFEKMKLSTPNVICVSAKAKEKAFGHADCVLIGNGMDVDSRTQKEVERVLLSRKKCVIDAAALRCLPLHLLHKDCILTPHAGEFEAAFGFKPTKETVLQMAQRYGCTILLKGRKDVLAEPGRLICIPGGNAGMTKGGTGDVLAGLLGALWSWPSCPSAFCAAYSASVINKRAGEMLYEAFGPNFSSEDLACELAFAARGFYGERHLGKPKL
ncbi:MAG: NAD(P)H-hydrate dehydratase [Candidatus Micrarchaeota archaeon]|nr:NAD(P)H-hydrate dehydratase [Candidatus Micrarchaeota archaeon]